MLSHYVLATDKLHGDDTPVPVLAPGTGKTKTGRFWTYVRDNRPAADSNAPAVWFSYSPDRKGEHPQRHLAKFMGVLQADEFAGFDRLYQSGAIQEAPCMAHLRRKFVDIVKVHQSPIATEAVERIAALYRIDKEIKVDEPKNGGQSVPPGPSHCSMTCDDGLNTLSQSSCPSPTLQRRFITPSASGTS